MKGFQWVNGSFVENITQLENREPRDIDVVTFYHIPHGHTQESILAEHPDLFNHQFNKDRYHMDAYFVELNIESTFYLSKTIAFWHSLWSHIRAGSRKGYLAVDLASNEDMVARGILNLAADAENLT